MTAPRLVLPQDSMPWGRWIEAASSQTEEAIRIQRANLGSSGSQFIGRSDVIGDQIANISNVSTQYTYVFPDYTRSKPSGSFLDPNVMFESPPITFSPPRPVGSYRLLVFGNMIANQVAGTSNLDYAYTYMMVGSTVYAQPTLEENRAGLFTVQNFNKTASIAAWDNVSDGKQTTVKLGLFVEPFNARTVEFKGCSITSVYVGGL